MEVTQQQKPSWLQIAERYIGTHEAPGAANNPVIVRWAAHFGPWIEKYYTADSIPWCGLFQGYVFEQDGKKTPGDALLAALSWASWGQSIPRAILGAVLVFNRPGGHHVAQYVGEDDQAYHCLGGNQSDSVCIERIPKAHCIAIRWPSEVAPSGEPVFLSAEGQPVATNEA